MKKASYADAFFAAGFRAAAAFLAPLGRDFCALRFAAQTALSLRLIAARSAALIGRPCGLVFPADADRAGVDPVRSSSTLMVASSSALS